MKKGFASNLKILMEKPMVKHGLRKTCRRPLCEPVVRQLSTAGEWLKRSRREINARTESPYSIVPFNAGAVQPVHFCHRRG